MSLEANKQPLVDAVTAALTESADPTAAAIALADAIEAYVATIVIACVEGEDVSPTP